MLKTLTLIVSVVIALGLVVLLGVMARPDGAGSCGSTGSSNLAVVR